MKSINIFAFALVQVAWAEQELDNTQLSNELAINEPDDGLSSIEDLLDGVHATNLYDRGYFRSIPYQKDLTAAQKVDQLWKILVPDETVVEEPLDFLWSDFDHFFTKRTADSFCDVSDVLRGRSIKTTHRQGVVAKVAWRVVDSRFSGIYEHGSESVILRLSETRNLTEESDGLLPSMAMKFLIDHRRSENLFGMPNMTGVYEDGETSWDFFRAPLKSRVERLTSSCEVDSLERKMAEGNNRPYATSVSRHAAMGIDGVLLDLDDPAVFKFPYQLDYEGTHNFPHEKRDLIWYDQLKGHFNNEYDLSDDVPIMKVFGWDAPQALGGNRIHIADIVLKSKLHTSQWGDDKLYFQHQRVNVDRKRWPGAWKRLGEDPEFAREEADFPGLSSWDKTDEEAEDFITNAIAPDAAGVRGCPFSWLFDASLL